MGTNTAIDWCEHTLNFWRGCTKVSTGCQNCYMFRGQRQHGNDPEIVTRCGKQIWHQPFAKGKNAWKPGDYVMACSWSDFFHPDADAWREEAWDVFRKRPDLIWVIVTKRIERAAECFPADWGDGWKNVILMVTAENQKRFLERGRILRDLPAIYKGFSAEPLLGPIEVEELIPDGQPNWINWIILGFESGPDARPGHPWWVIQVRDWRVSRMSNDQSAFFFKQWGEWEWRQVFDDSPAKSTLAAIDPSHRFVDFSGLVIAPGDSLSRAHVSYPIAEMSRVGKKRAGNVLFGETYQQRPV
jgi:protein gp37